MDDLLLSPMEQLDASLKHLAEIVFTSHQTAKLQSGTLYIVRMYYIVLHGKQAAHDFQLTYFYLGLVVWGILLKFTHRLQITFFICFIFLKSLQQVKS